MKANIDEDRTLAEGAAVYWSGSAQQ